MSVQPQGTRFQALMLGAAVLAGVWGLLSPLFLFLPIYEPKVVTTPVVRDTAFAVHRVGEAMAALGPALAAGALGLAGAWLVARRASVGRALLGVSAAGLMLLSVFTAASHLGWFLFPPAFLFILAALWLEGSPLPNAPSQTGEGAERERWG